MPFLKNLLIAALVCLASPLPSHAADDFEPDDAITDINTLTHRSPVQIHTLEGAPDVDVFNVYSIPGRSYEVTLHNMGRLGRGGVSMELMDFSMTSVQLYSTDLRGDVFDGDTNNNRAIRWADVAAPSAIYSIYRLRVQGSGNADVKYAVSLRESTLYCPRFNNSGTQATVLLVQRTGTDWASYFPPTSRACSVHQIYYDESGNRLQVQSGDLQSNAMLVQATSAIPALTGKKGSIQIAHTCGYGGIKAKAVALEPATGFSFDTPCSERP